MIRLSDCAFKHSYKTGADDILSDFYVKALSVATNYDRVSAYFSSEILGYYSQGIENIVQKKGKIRFIFSYEISKEDYDKIIIGYQNRAKIEMMLLEKLEGIGHSGNISNLAYLISIGIVDIKIAFVKEGLLHDKFGLIYDESGTLYFRGSNNETISAVKSNYEKFETTCSWDANEHEIAKISDAVKDFSDLWNDRVEGVKVVMAPECVLEEIDKFNKGEIVKLAPPYCSFPRDALFLDITPEFHLYAINNVESDNAFCPQSFYIKQIASYITKYDFNRISFIDNLKINDIKILIEHFKTTASRRSITFIVSPRLKNFLENYDIEIERRVKPGVAIKNRYDDVYEKYRYIDAIISNNLERKLYDLQTWCSFHSIMMMRSANFSVPGSGKTSVVYGIFAYLSDPSINRIDRIVVFGPKSSFMSWKEEFDLNFGPKKTMKVLDIQENSIKKGKEYELLYESTDKNLILINYEAIPSLETSIIESKIINEKTLLVLDEVHRVKNPKGIRAKSVLKIVSSITGPKYRIALSGTPIPNTFSDLFMPLNILFPNEYGDYFRFTERELGLADSNALKQDEINESIYPFFTRINKQDLKVPPPEKDDITTGSVCANSTEKQIFDIIYKAYGDNTLALFIRLMQASTNPKLILKKPDDDDLREIGLFKSDEDDDYEDDNAISNAFYANYAKATRVNINKMSKEEIDLIRGYGMTQKFYRGIAIISKLVAERRQVIAWAVFVNTLDEIFHHLKEAKITCKVVCGSTPQEDREKIIKEFVNGEFNVLITNPHTLGESVSLHKNCHDAVYFEYSFNLTHLLQSKDRIHRLGLKPGEKTHYYFLSTVTNEVTNSPPIDMRIYQRLKNKEERMIKTLEGTRLEVIKEDYTEDLEYIFSRSK